MFSIGAMIIAGLFAAAILNGVRAVRAARAGAPVGNAVARTALATATIIAVLAISWTR